VRRLVYLAPAPRDRIAMFTMFECKGWSHGKRQTYILGRAKAPAAKWVATAIAKLAS